MKKLLMAVILCLPLNAFALNHGVAYQSSVKTSLAAPYMVTNALILTGSMSFVVIKMLNKSSNSSKSRFKPRWHPRQSLNNYHAHAH
jgi:hypothetical protein